LLLQSIESEQNLPGLVGLRFALEILNIHSRIPRPWGFENRMAGAALPRFAEIRHANLLQIGKANLRRAAAHPVDDPGNLRHDSWYQ
jgi:hypothetical protein